MNKIIGQTTCFIQCFECLLCLQIRIDIYKCYVCVQAYMIEIVCSSKALFYNSILKLEYSVYKRVNGTFNLRTLLKIRFFVCDVRTMSLPCSICTEISLNLLEC